MQAGAGSEQCWAARPCLSPLHVVSEPWLGSGMFLLQLSFQLRLFQAPGCPAQADEFARCLMFACSSIGRGFCSLREQAALPVALSLSLSQFSLLWGPSSPILSPPLLLQRGRRQRGREGTKGAAGKPLVQSLPWLLGPTRCIHCLGELSSDHTPPQEEVVNRQLGKTCSHYTVSCSHSRVDG